MTKTSTSSSAADAATEMSETPESSLMCLGKILYRHMGLDVDTTPEDEELLLWQCALLLLKLRSGPRWKNVDATAKAFLKNMVVSVKRKYPLYGEKVRYFCCEAFPIMKEYRFLIFASVGLICIMLKPLLIAVFHSVRKYVYLE